MRGIMSRGVWPIFQQPLADDYVLPTVEARSVREFFSRAFVVHEGISIIWSGQGVEEVLRYKKKW